MIPLSDHFPGMDSLEFFAKRYKELDISAVESYLAIVRVSGRLQSRADAYFQRMDLSQGRFMVLMMLSKASEVGRSPAELAQHISCARATVTGLLDTLEASGFVERHADAGGDRRSLTVRITAAGQKKLDTILPSHYQRIALAMADFSQEERKELTRLLGKFNKALTAFEDTSSGTGENAPDQLQSKKEKP